MKKLIVMVAVVACAVSMVSAQVTSSNVVGYVKTATPAAGSFDIVSLGLFGPGNTVNIQDAIANLTDLNASGVFADADKLYVWNGAAYATYGLHFKASTSETFWMASGIGWSIPTFANPANVNLTRGNSVWYQSGTGGTATAIKLGEVPNDGTYNVSIGAGFSLIAYPYTSDINLNALVVGGATSSAVFATADKMYVWNGSAYATYGLHFKASTSETFWMASGIGWSIPTFANPANVVLDLGKGFWYESSDGAKTLTFSQNYSL